MEMVNATASEPANALPTTAADVAIATLEAHGVDTVFGVPGVHTLALYDALTRSSITHILARHEQGAGFMADGYARATGRPGVAVVITGPGITNVATPVGEAYGDSSPVFVLSSNVECPFLDSMRGSLHDLKDQIGIMAALTEWNTRVMDGADISRSVSEAMHRVSAGRRLPVHVEVPLDVLDAVVADAKIERMLPAGKLTPDRYLVEDAASRLQSARKPVLYCGGGAVSSGAGGHVIALAERLGAPILTSIMGKGSVPEDHPLVIGALWSPDNDIDALLREADCMVVFGSKLGVQATDHFRLPIPEHLIRVDVDERELTLNARPALAILGDASLVAEGMVRLLASRKFSAPGFGAGRVNVVRDRARESAFGAQRLPYIDALRRAIPRDGIVSFDMTMMSYTACYLYPAYLPRTFLFPSGYGTLGFAFPAALGAKVGCPQRAVACVVGDGGFQYTMEELGTAVQHRLGVPIVIFNDSTYSAIKAEQARTRGGRFIAADLVNPDYVKLAEAYSIPGVRADNPDALESALAEALTRDLPTIIDVPIEPWA